MSNKKRLTNAELKERTEQMKLENRQAGIGYHKRRLSNLFDQAVERGVQDAHFFILTLAIAAQDYEEHHFEMEKLRMEIAFLSKRVEGIGFEQMLIATREAEASEVALTLPSTTPNP